MTLILGWGFDADDGDGKEEVEEGSACAFRGGDFASSSSFVEEIAVVRSDEMAWSMIFWG